MDDVLADGGGVPCRIVGDSAPHAILLKLLFDVGDALADCGNIGAVSFFLPDPGQFPGDLLILALEEFSKASKAKLELLTLYRKRDQLIAAGTRRYHAGPTGKERYAVPPFIYTELASSVDGTRPVPGGIYIFVPPVWKPFAK